MARRGKHAAEPVVTPARSNAQRCLLEFLEKPYDLAKWAKFRTALVRYADEEGLKLDRAYEKVANA